MSWKLAVLTGAEEIGLVEQTTINRVKAVKAGKPQFADVKFTVLEQVGLWIKAGNVRLHRHQI